MTTKGKEYYNRVFDVLKKNESMIIFTFNIFAYKFAFELFNKQQLENDNLKFEYKMIVPYKYEIKLCPKA